MLADFFRKRWYKWTEGRVDLPVAEGVETVRLGSSYGGWIIPSRFVREQDTCLLVGAGEDISFDLELTHQSGCMVHIADPTPRAIQHVDDTLKHIRLQEPAPCKTAADGHYPQYPEVLAERIRLHPVGLWDKDTTLEFYLPEDESHVSHSIVNLQKTGEAIKVPVNKPSTLLSKLGISHLRILKIDIEGAEYKVLQSLLDDKVEVDVLCIEYDESARMHIDGQYMKRIRQSLQSLVNAGYLLVAKESDCHNYTMIHKRCLR